MRVGPICSQSPIAGDACACARSPRDLAPVIHGIGPARAGREPRRECRRGRASGDARQASHLARTDKVESRIHAIARHEVIDVFRRHGRRIDVPVEYVAEVMPEPDPTELPDMLRVVGELAPREAEIVRGIGLDVENVTRTVARHGMTLTSVRERPRRGVKWLAGLRARMIR